MVAADADDTSHDDLLVDDELVSLDSIDAFDSIDASLDSIDDAALDIDVEVELEEPSPSRRGEAHARVEALEGEVDAAPSDAERIRALVQIAQIHERDFLKPEVAAEKLVRALALDPTHVEALDGLVRCHRAARAWDGLVDALTRRAEVEKEPGRRAQLWAQIAEVHGAHCGDLEAATRAYTEALRHRPRSRRILWALARLAEKRGDYVEAAARHTRRAELTNDPARRAQIHCAVGELLDVEAHDADGAKESFERAVLLDPTRGRAWDALATHAKKEGDAARAAHCLEQRARHERSPRVRAGLLVEAGHLLVDDPDAAHDAFDAAFSADPTNEEAAAAVLEEYVARREWVKAKAACALLLDPARKRGDRARLAELLAQWTRIAQASGDGSRALLGLLASYELSPREDGIEDRLIAAAHAVKDQPEALAPARAVLENLARDGRTLTPAGKYRLGDLLAELGDRERAADFLAEALAAIPHHIPALDRLTEIAEAQGDHLIVARCRRAKARASHDPMTKAHLFVEAGDVMLRRLKDARAAAADYEEARALRPADSQVLHALLGAYTDLGEWGQVTGVLRSIADAEGDVVKRARVVFTIAQVVDERLGDATWAAELFTEVLDLDASRLDAFEKVVGLYTELGEWQALADAYVTMVKRKRTSEDVALKHALCHQLGLIYRDRLGDAELALASFRAALEIRPDAEEDRTILAELLVVLDDLPSAVELVERSLLRAPEAEGPLRELYGLFLRQRRFDRAWCAADLLALRAPLDDEQASFLTRFPTTALPLVEGTLTPTAWESHLFHPELDAILTELFRTVSPALLRAKKAARDARGDARVTAILRIPERVRRAFADAVDILGLEPVRLRVRTEIEQPFVAADDGLRTILVSPDLSATLDDEVLAYLAGKHVALAAPELVARTICPTSSELASLVGAAIRVGAAADLRAVTPDRFETALLTYMNEDEMRALRDVVVEVLRAQPLLDVKKWAEHAVLSAVRVGLLLAQSTAAMKRAEGHERRTPSDPPPSRLWADVTAFVIGDAYAELRVALGLAVRER